jgi:hypothetical protein
MKKKDWNYVKDRFRKIFYYIREGVEIGKKVPSYEEILADKEYSSLIDRVNYYCKLDEPFQVSKKASMVGSFKKTKSFTYFADLKKTVRHFPAHYEFDYIFGDVVDVPKIPSFVKSRPINDENNNSILLKLNAIRHFRFYKDEYEFESKKPLSVFRGMVYHKHRRDFVDLYFDSDFSDVGHNDEKLDFEPSYKGFMSVQNQLAYRYIVSIEGKDVATNLKWIMASNSVCFMRRPRFETWFMEGLLVPGVHYVELKDDFSDLKEKVCYYNDHTDEALEIVRNANQYVKQFLLPKQEKIVEILVAKKYFELTLEQ